MRKINFKVITLFPELITSYLQEALLSKAIEKSIINVEIVDLKKFSQNKYNSVDDTVFGGGDGMLMQYRPLAEALKSLGIIKLESSLADKKIVYLSPQGKKWTNQLAKEWSAEENIILICGRYAGIDQRFIHQFVDTEISVGDYVLSGGELAALTLIETISRFIPGVVGHSQSAFIDSFENDLLEAPQFTKPQVEDELHVPATLLSGNHQKISEWRKFCAILVTLKKRPDLLEKQNINWSAVKDFYQQLSTGDKTVLDLNDLEFHL